MNRIMTKDEKVALINKVEALLSNADKNIENLQSLLKGGKY